MIYLVTVIIKIQMGQTNNGQAISNGEYTVLRETPNGSIVKQLNNNRLHFLKEYSFTNQEAYQQAFINFSKKLPEKHQHILYLQRTNTKLENTFCSTFYKISLVYEYFDHTLQREIEQRNQQRKVFDQKEVWSVLCSCTLGVSEMIRMDGRSHAALSTKDIRLNEQGLVKILSLEMVGMDNDHDSNQQGTTKQLALTVLNCLLMQQITNDSEEFLLDLIQNLQSTVEMKNILKLMINPSTKFIQLQQYLFRMVQEETDSLNSYSNTPVLKEKQARPQNSYSKIHQQSKEDDSLASLLKDHEDLPDTLHDRPDTLEEEIPDQNDVVDDNRSKTQQQQYSLRQNQSEQTSPRKSKCRSPKSSNFKFTSNQENSLFTDPKLLNLIHSDLEELKKRKSVAGSRNLGSSESSKLLQQKTQTKILNNISNQVPSTSNANDTKISQSNVYLSKKNQQHICDFKIASINPNGTSSLTNLSHSKQPSLQSNSSVRMNSSNVRRNENLSSSSIETEKQLKNSKCKAMDIIEPTSNPEQKVVQKRYENIMEIQDMGFKKNKAKPKEEVKEEKKEQKKQESRVSVNIQNSNVVNTVVYNSNASSNFNSNGLVLNPYQSQKSKTNLSFSKASSQVKETKLELEYVTQTYIRGRYEGTKLNNMRHGKGVFYYNEGGKYIGEWQQNKMNGKGVLYYPNNQIAYDGEWKDDQLWGKGTLYNEQVSPLNNPFDYRNWDYADEYWIKYEGQFSQDSKNGQGKLYLSNGQIFEGSFKDDMVWGEGTLLRRDGSRLKGIWRQNKLIRIY